MPIPILPFSKTVKMFVEVAIVRTAVEVAGVVVAIINLVMVVVAKVEIPCALRSPVTTTLLEVRLAMVEVV